LTSPKPDFVSWLSSVQPVVEQALAETLDRSTLRQAPPRLQEAVRRSLLSGGKRLRPALCLLACSAEGGSMRRALPAAVAVECVHTYSLVHDDLPCMDDDALRRGQPTLHVLYGEALAVLAGDALQALAFECLAEQDDALLARDQARILAAASGPRGMVGGQVLDMESEGQPSDAARVRSIHEAKTGALLAAALACGARAAEADGQRWMSFGSTLGRLFQATDDLLDATLSSVELGKTAGKDRDTGKATLLAVHGLDGARSAAHEEAEIARRELAVLAPRARYDELADLPRFLEERVR
jgi:geranylgeranyl pyrophosphate synthase